MWKSSLGLWKSKEAICKGSRAGEIFGVGQEIGLYASGWHVLRALQIYFTNFTHSSEHQVKRN